MAGKTTEPKKYYWLKLKRDFFKRHDIQIIESMPNGKDYILFYLKLLLESIDHEGALRFSDAIPYNEQMLSVITNTNIDIVRSAMKVFAELNMLEVFDDETIFMTEVSKLIGSETAGAERVRRLREKQKALQCNADVTKCNTEIEIDIRDRDKSIDTEIDTEIINTGGGGERARVREEIQKRFEIFFDKTPTEFEISAILKCMILLYYPNEEEFTCSKDDVFLLEKAMETAAKGSDKPAAYIEGVYHNYRKRKIKTEDDYWDYEVDRDMKSGKI